MSNAVTTFKIWYARVARPLRIFLWLLFCLWLGWLIASWVWWLSVGPTLVSTDSPFEMATTGATNSVAPTATLPGEWRFFGVASEVPVAEPDAPAPDTRLRLELVGLFFHQDVKRGSAIISAEGKQAELYRVDETIPGGNASLSEVHADRVILLRAGQRETLRLQELRAPAGMASSAPVAPERAATIQQLRGVQPRRPGEGDEPVSLDSLVQGGADASQLRQQAISQLGMTSLGDGQGYRIGARAPAAVLQSVGLRPGDIVKSVNGHMLGDEGADIAALEEFRSTGTASITVQRGSQEITVNFPP